jgi:hypothetical protein
MAGFLEKILKESQGNGSMWTNLFRIAQSHEIHYPMELSWLLLPYGDPVNSISHMKLPVPAYRRQAQRGACRARFGQESGTVSFLVRLLLRK